MKEKIKGFTLIELIIVIAIIAILAAIAFVAVNPAKRLGDANNDQRWADVTAIADAWEKYTTDKLGVFPVPAIDATKIYEIGAGFDAVNCQNDDGLAVDTALDLQELVTEGYLGVIPSDDQTLSTSGNGYYFEIDTNNIIKVGSCTSYDSAVIYVTR